MAETKRPDPVHDDRLTEGNSAHAPRCVDAVRDGHYFGQHRELIRELVRDAEDWRAWK